MSGYKDPNVYVDSVLNGNYNTGFAPSLIPVIVGSGAYSFTKKVTMTKDSVEDYDVLPSINVLEISKVGDSYGKVNYTIDVDYELDGANHINWLSGVGAVKPTNGATYYVEYTAAAEDAQYEMKLLTSKSEVVTAFGEDIKEEDGSVCPISLGAQLAIESGTNLVYAIQTRPVFQEIEIGITGPASSAANLVFTLATTDTVTVAVADLATANTVITSVIAYINATYPKKYLATAGTGKVVVEYLLPGSKAGAVYTSGPTGIVLTPSIKTAGSYGEDVNSYSDVIENELQFIDDGYRIVPMDMSDDVNMLVYNHVLAMSTPDEGKERKAILGAIHNSTTFQDLLTNMGDFTTGYANDRIMTVYPDVASRTLSDGNVYDLSAPYIAAAIAGKKASMSVQNSLTRTQIAGFIELKGIKMLRTQMNLLAEKGVMILEQKSGAGSPFTIRHQLTTDMTDVQTREDSIGCVRDYVSKYMRTGMQTYIGKYNITQEVISRMKGTANTLIDTLKSSGVITEGNIITLRQDTNNPDTIIMEIAIKPPYPCNYIYITIFVN